MCLVKSVLLSLEVHRLVAWSLQILNLYRVPPSHSLEHTDQGDQPFQLKSINKDKHECKYECN